MKKNVYAGKFFALEGLDGSGQTTQANLLVNALREKGKNVLVTKEPTQNSEAGKRIRNVLDKKEVLDADELQKLFAQDRKEHLENTIVPALQKGIWVIADRYAFSSFAFGAAEEVDLEQLIALNNEFLLPDATFLLKVRPDVCMERIQRRTKPLTLFEHEQKMKKVWGIYQILPDKFANIYTIDGEQPIEEVASDIWQIISPP